MTSIGGVPPSESDYILRCRREGLRDYLWQHIPVQTEKQFIHYKEDDNGVTAYFKDGTSATGAMLVGADGAGSPVRQQLLSSTSDAAPYIPIVGLCELPKEKYMELHKISNAVILAGSEHLRYMVGKLSMRPDGSSASYYWATCFRTGNPQEDAKWSTDQVSKQDLYEKALDITKDIPAHLTDIIRFTGAEGIKWPSIRFAEFVPPSVMPRGRVTLLGDSAHAMMPFRGAGANTAITDACDLSDLIVENGGADVLNDGEILKDLLQEYASVMVPRGRAMVAASRAAGEDINYILGLAKDGPRKQKPERNEWEEQARL